MNALPTHSTTVTFSGPLVTLVATTNDGQPVNNFVLADDGSLDSAPGEGMAAQPVNITVTVTSPNGSLSTIVASGTILPPPPTPVPGP